MEHGDVIPYSASPETRAAKRAIATKKPVYFDNEMAGFVTALRRAHNGSDAFWDSFLFSMFKAMKAARFPSLFSRGLVGALDEMQSNIHEHSNASDTGLIAYRVDLQKIEWTVADRGIGVLTGLRTGAFPSLKDSGEALKIALSDGYSRFGAAEGRGYGFKELFKALSARHGTLRFRSDDQVLTMSGLSPVLSRACLQQRAHISGLSVTVVCTKPSTRL